MNAGISGSHPSIIYYDSDYPSIKHSVYPENVDNVVIEQGIIDDVAKYQNLTHAYGKQVLELCCGTGRVSIPLVEYGCNVTAIDISHALLKQFTNKIKIIKDFSRHNLNIVQQDVSELSLTKKDFDVVICAFNSLLCIPDFSLQQQTLFRAAAHLRQNGLLALDIWNPLVINIYGDEKPEPFFTRRNSHNGNTYTRFAAVGPMDINQVQRVYGWYDETLPDGTIQRETYEMRWKLIFRYEIELMLEKAGFAITKISGGNNNEPLTPESLKMFIEAVKV